MLMVIPPLLLAAALQSGPAPSSKRCPRRFLMTYPSWKAYPIPFGLTIEMMHELVVNFIQGVRSVGCHTLK